jgi:hypothetical protein
LRERPATGIDCRRYSNAWSGLVSTFANVPPDLRRTVRRRVVEGLRPGGVLAGLVFEVAREREREVFEGRYHQGRGHVVQIVGRKPAVD